MGPGLLQQLLFALQRLLRLDHRIGGLVHLVQAALIGSGDLLNHIQPVQQIRKAAGLEQHRPIGKTAVFLHGADALLVLLAQGIEAIARLLILVLFIRDKHGIGTDLLIGIIDLRVKQGDLLIDDLLLGNDLLHFGKILADLPLQFIDPGLQLRLLLLQSVDLLPDLSRGSGSCSCGQYAGDQAQQHKRCHQARDQ